MTYVGRLRDLLREALEVVEEDYWSDQPDSLCQRIRAALAKPGDTNDAHWEKENPR